MSGIQSVSVSAAQSYASASPQSQSLQPFSNLNLTEAQRTQLRSIFTNAKQNGTSQADVQQQVNSVLSPAQQQTLAADLKTGGAHHGHHHRESSDSSSDTTASAAGSTSSTDTSNSTSATVLTAVTNIQNQAAAAQSTLIDSLQKQLLASNTPASAQSTTSDA